MRKFLGGALAASWLVSASWLVATPPALAASEEQVFYDLLRFVQVESLNLDQAYVLDTSGSMKSTLPVARKMMANFVRDLARDGDRLLVVAVGAQARVLVDEQVDQNNRTRLVSMVESPRLTELGAAFEAYTDLDAGTFSVLKRFDKLNEERVRRGELPRRQLLHTFSDFKPEPAPGSPFSGAGSAQATELKALKGRVELRKAKSADAIQAGSKIDFRGVPFRIEQTEFVVPGAPRAGAAAGGTFDGYLRQMIAEDFETRRRTATAPKAFAKRIEKMRAEVAKRLAVTGPVDFTTAPDGVGVVGVIKVKNGFERTTFQGLGIAAGPGEGQTTAVLPTGTTELAPGQETTFEVQFPALQAPAWYATEGAVYAGQKLIIQPQGSAIVTDVKSRPLAIAALIAAQTLAFDIAIPANPAWLYGLLGLLVFLALAGVVFWLRWRMGPRELSVRLRIHDVSGEPSVKEAKLANGGFQTLGGKERGSVHLVGIDEPLVKIVRQGRTVVAESCASKLTVMVDAALLKPGVRVVLKEKGRIVVKQDTVGPHVVEIGYQQGEPSALAPPSAGSKPDLADPDSPKYSGTTKKRF